MPGTDKRAGGRGFSLMMKMVMLAVVFTAVIVRGEKRAVVVLATIIIGVVMTVQTDTGDVGSGVNRIETMEETVDSIICGGDDGG